MHLEISPFQKADSRQTIGYTTTMHATEGISRPVAGYIVFDPPALLRRNP
jgi:hypothetical protein